MGNIATSVEAQIRILKERGLLIENDQKAVENLLDIGYYRLGFYFYYFQNPLTHNFEENVRLDDIIDLYYFDFDIKMLLLRYIYRIEVHFRTQLVYHTSNLYSTNNVWYNDPKIVNNDILKEFNNIYYIFYNRFWDNIMLYIIFFLNLSTPISLINSSLH